MCLKRPANCTSQNVQAKDTAKPITYCLPTMPAGTGNLLLGSYFALMACKRCIDSWHTSLSA
eukprot:m.44710 g.44710  ORF g.44710 m.44710 type:complete len:62 (-) comp13042_c0_seq1:1313-1498(-)